MWDGIFKNKARAMQDFSTDDILSALGLQRQRTMYDAALPTTLAFMAGAAAGAGIALLLAPKSGREMRQDISNKATELTNKASELTKSLTSTANELAEDVRSASLSEERRADRSLSGSNRSTS
jgi:YtxH-like protein